MTIRPKQFARLDEFHLNVAILYVLLEAKHEGGCLGVAEPVFFVNLPLNEEYSSKNHEKCRRQHGVCEAPCDEPCNDRRATEKCKSNSPV